MYCKYCGGQLDKQAKFCTNCGRGGYNNTTIDKPSIVIVISVVLIILCTYGIFAGTIGITDEGESSPIGFAVLLLLAGGAIAMYKTRVYLITITCYGVLSIIYLYRIINLQELSEKYWQINLGSFQTLYWAYFIILSISSIILAIKYLYECKNERILNVINRLKNKRLTGDDMNKVVLSGMHKKGNRLLLIIGISSCIIGILSMFFLLKSFISNEGSFYRYGYFNQRELGFSIIGRFIGRFFDMSISEYYILSILYFTFIGIFLYAIYSNVKSGKPIMQLSRCFNIALYAFIIQFCSSISFMIYDHDSKIKVVSLIVNVINIGLCFSFYIFRDGFKNKLGGELLKSSIIFSMICLWISLAIGVFNVYNLHEELDMSYNSWNADDMFGILKDVMEVFLTIILLLVLNNMKKNLKSQDVGVNESEEKPPVM